MFYIFTLYLLYFSHEGLEIYSAVMKVKACQNVRDGARDAVRSMRTANSDMDKMIKEVNIYKAKLSDVSERE